MGLPELVESSPPQDRSQGMNENPSENGQTEDQIDTNCCGDDIYVENVSRVDELLEDKSDLYSASPPRRSRRNAGPSEDSVNDKVHSSSESSIPASATEPTAALPPRQPYPRYLPPPEIPGDFLGQSMAVTRPTPSSFYPAHVPGPERLRDSPQQEPANTVSLPPACLFNLHPPNDDNPQNHVFTFTRTYLIRCLRNHSQ
jgi:hypothetical protein